MEKLLAVQRDPRYDLIVLDTPPTSNALDFLDAPERLIEALDSAAMRWFVQAFGVERQVQPQLWSRKAPRSCCAASASSRAAASSSRWRSSSPSSTISSAASRSARAQVAAGLPR